MPAVLAEATDRANRSEVNKLAALVKSKLRPQGTVGILGLSYKPNTDVVEESQGLYLAQFLAAEGIPVICFDPAAIENAARQLPPSVRIGSSLTDCVTAADVIVITTPWSDFQTLTTDMVTRDGIPRTIIDCWRILVPDRFPPSIEYVRLGVGKLE